MRTRSRRIAVALLALCLTVSCAWSVRRWARSLSHAALHQAEIAYGRGEFPSALRFAFVQLEATPGDREAALLAGRCLDRMGKPVEADTLDKMAGAVPAADLHVHALALMAAGRHDMAEATYKELLAANPDDDVALRRLAATYLGLIRLREVFPLADRLAALPDHSARVAGETLRGLVHHRVEEYEPAALALERVLVLDPDLREMPLKPPTTFWYYLGTDLLTSGRPADARKYMERALEGGPDPSLLDVLGQALHAEADMEGAERCWREAIALAPDHAGALLRLGRSLLRRNRADEALPMLERASALRPSDREPAYTLQQARRRLGLASVPVPDLISPAANSLARQPAEADPATVRLSP
ncbi:tetratricopeptide repeat protein [Isosphaeraceae bacterium EP7]